MGLEQIRQRRLAVLDALAPHLGRMGGDHRDQHRPGRVGRAGRRIDPGNVLQALQRAVVGQGLAAGQMIVGDVGQLGEDREGADQDEHVRQGQRLQPLAQGHAGRTVTVLADGVAAHVLDPLETARSVLLADHLAEQPAEQPDAGAAGGLRRPRRDLRGVESGQGGHGERRGELGVGA